MRNLSVIFAALIVFSQLSFAQNVYTITKPVDWQSTSKQIQLDMSGLIQEKFFEFSADVAITLTGDGKIQKMIPVRFPDRTSFESIDQTKWSFVEPVSVSDKSANYRFRVRADVSSDTSHFFWKSGSERVLWEHFILFDEMPTKGRLKMEFTNIKATDQNGAAVSGNSSACYEIDYGGIETKPDSMSLSFYNNKTWIKLDGVHQKGYGQAEIILKTGDKPLKADSLAFELRIPDWLEWYDLALVPAGVRYSTAALPEKDGRMVYKVKLVGTVDSPANSSLGVFKLRLLDLPIDSYSLQLDSLRIWYHGDNLTKIDRVSLPISVKDAYNSGFFRKGDANKQFGDSVLNDADLKEISQIIHGTSSTITNYQLWAADMDNNGLVNQADYDILDSILNRSSIMDLDEAITVQAWPTPCSSSCTINLPESLNSDFYLFDFSGRQVTVRKELSDTSIKIFVEDLVDGQYLFVIKNGKFKPIVGKIVKQ